MGEADAAAPRPREAALDVLRGAAVAGMIFVNNPGDWGHVAAPFAHAEWHGLTPADVVFPFFVFSMGCSAVYSLERRREAGAPIGVLAFQTFVRGSLLVLLGWGLALFPFGAVKWLRGDFDGAAGGSAEGWWDFVSTQLNYLRIPGVLPRLGVVYIVGAWILIGVRRAESIAVAIAALFAIHTHLLFGFGLPLDPDSNVQKSIDDSLLAGHLYTREDTDPEGIVSTLSSIATMLCGALAGLTLRSELAGRTKTLRLLAGGTAGIALGLALSPWIPVNKKLWTPAFALLTAGLAAWSLQAARLLTSEPLAGRRGVRGAAGALSIFGRNPLAAFLLSGALAILLGQVRIGGSGGPPVSLHAWLYGGLAWIPDLTVRSHAFALLFLGAMFAILAAMDRRGWRWKL